MAGRRTTLLVGAIVAAGLALASLGIPRCTGPGMGGDGVPEGPAPAEPAETPTSAETKVVVENQRCVLDGAAAAPCPEVCRDLLERAPEQVVLDGAAGAHGVVEDLRTCLSEGGLSVRMLGS